MFGRTLIVASLGGVGVLDIAGRPFVQPFSTLWLRPNTRLERTAEKRGRSNRKTLDDVRSDQAEP